MSKKTKESVDSGEHFSLPSRSSTDGGGISIPVDTTMSQLEQLKDIIDRSPMMVFIWKVSENWDVEYVSENISQLGYNAEDFTSGRVSWPGITYPEDVPRLEKEVAEYMKSGATKFAQEYRLVANDNSIRWVEDRNTILRDGDGTITHIQGIVFETTERHRIKEELIENQKRVQALLNASHESLTVIDTDGSILKVNSTTAERLGKQAEEIVGTKIWELFPGDIIDYRKAQLEKAIKSRKPVRFQDRRGDFWFDSTICPILDESGRVTAAAVFGADITARVEADRELKTAYEQMEELVKRRTAELAQANAELVVEREALKKKNEALKEVLDRIELTKKETGQKVESNIDRLVMPILREMENLPNLKNSNYLSLLRSTIEDVVAPFVGTGQVPLTKLSDRELEVCNMIKQGFSSKQIADMFHTSTQTVLKQRKMIRKKLRISGKKINLSSYLKRLK